MSWFHIAQISPPVPKGLDGCNPKCQRRSRKQPSRALSDHALHPTANPGGKRTLARKPLTLADSTKVETELFTGGSVVIVFPI